MLPALLYRALLSPERRRDLFAEQSGSLDVLLGGRKLLLVFGRRTEPRGAAAVSASLRAMQHVEVERRFEAPPAQVWKVYTDHAGWTSWAGLGRARLVAEGQPDRNGVGAVRCFSTGGVSVFEEVLSFEPPKRMSYRVVRGGIPIMKDHLGEVAARARWRGHPVDLALPLRFQDPRTRGADALAGDALVPPGARGSRPAGLRDVSKRASELERRLEDLQAELARTQDVDPKSLELLDHVRREIESVLARSEEPDPSSLRGRLEAAISHFETSHPVLTATMGRVIDQLANLGI